MCINAWYLTKGLWDGYRLWPLWILRLLCKRTGTTISMHPDFFHHHKRATFPFVLSCIREVITLGRPVAAVAECHAGLTRWTLSRWRDGLTEAHIHQKRLCFFGTAVDDGEEFGCKLLAYFKKTGKGLMQCGAIRCMVRLWERFCRPLY